MATAEASTINTIGRRKTAVASIRLSAGTGTVIVNGRDIEDYFSTQQLRNLALFPLSLTDIAKKYDIKVNAKGGGLIGQAGALRLAISRAILKLNPESKTLLRQNGLLTRDPREKERKKPGQPGARKRFQFSKR